MKLAPIARGSLLGVAAAVLFGMSTPLITHLGRGVGAFVTATLLYGGATIGAGLPMRNAAPVIRRPPAGWTSSSAMDSPLPHAACSLSLIHI